MLPGVIKFIYPEFLFGLFILILPIVIHLFSFKRYKKVYFSNFNFLQSLQQERKNSSQIKKWLLLLLRLLTIAAIVIAFARPYIPSSSASESRITDKSPVAIYIDNSFSMSNTGAHGSLLEEAKKYMFDILNSYPSSTGFILITNDNYNHPLLSKEEASLFIAGIKTAPHTKKLSEIFKQVAERINGQNATLFLLSDFQKHICDFQAITPDTLISPVFLIIKPENMNNLYIKDVGFDQGMLHKKNQTDKISINIANSSERDFNNVPVNLVINNKKKSINKVNIAANREENIEISYLNTENGFYRGEVEITDFPVIFDNKFYFTYGISEKVNVLCLEQQQHNPFFGKLFSDTADFHISYAPISRTSDISFSNYNLIILDRINSISSGIAGELENYIQSGGNLFIIPGTEMSVNVLNRFLQKIHAPQYGIADSNMYIATIESQAPVFKNVFEKEEKNAVLPFAKSFYHLQTEKADILLKDKREHPVFVSKNFGQGTVYLSAFDFSPENGDIVYHPLFVPLMINMSYNIQSALNTSSFLGSDSPVMISGKLVEENKRLVVKKEDSSFEFIAEVRKDFSGNYILLNAYNIEDAGIYEVVQENGIVDLLAFNYARKESELQYHDEKELQKHFPEAKVENIRTTQLSRNSELVKEIVMQDKNKYLAWWFILLAISALLAEQFVWRKKLK